MTSIIFHFDLVHLYDLFCDELFDDIVEEFDVKEVLKSSIFVVQKATAPKSGVEFRQGSIGFIKSSLARSYDASRRRAASPCACVEICFETDPETQRPRYRGQDGSWPNHKNGKGGGGLALGCLKNLNPCLVSEGKDNVEAISVDIFIRNMKIRCCAAYGPQ